MVSPTQSLDHSGFSTRKCVIPGTIALGFDDGPWIYTEQVLDELDRWNAKATFFLTPAPLLPNGQTRTALYAPLVRRMFRSGHQVGMHGWAHEDLDKLSVKSREEVLRNSAAELGRGDMLNGLAPTYFRPPFGSCSTASGCRKHLSRLGYRIVFWDTDPRDWERDSSTEIQLAKNEFAEKLAKADTTRDSFLVAMHDIHEQTALNLTEFVLQLAHERGFKAVTVGECLGEKASNWYQPVASVESTLLHGLPSTGVLGSYYKPEGTSNFAFLLLAIAAAMSFVWGLGRYKALRAGRFH